MDRRRVGGIGIALLRWAAVGLAVQAAVALCVAMAGSGRGLRAPGVYGVPMGGFLGYQADAWLGTGCVHRTFATYLERRGGFESEPPDADGVWPAWTPWSVGGHAAWGLARRAEGRAKGVQGLNELRNGRDIGVGLPAVAFWCEVEGEYLHEPWRGGAGWPATVVRGGALLSEKHRPVNHSRIVPLRPVWAGVAVNTAFWGVAGCAAFASMRAVRQRRRVLRGWCPECGYDLGFDLRAGCAECGWGKRNGRSEAARTGRFVTNRRRSALRRGGGA